MIFDSNIVDWILVINPEFQYVFKLKKLYIYIYLFVKIKPPMTKIIEKIKKKTNKF